MKNNIYNIEPNKCSKRLNEALIDTLQIARVQRYEFVTPEQLMYVIAAQKEFVSFCKECGFNVEDISLSLSNYNDSMDRVDDKEEYRPVASHELSRLTDLANTNWETLNQGSKTKAEQLGIPDILRLCYEMDETVIRHILNTHLGDNPDTWLDSLAEIYMDNDSPGSEEDWVEEWDDDKDKDDIQSSEDESDAPDDDKEEEGAERDIEEELEGAIAIKPIRALHAEAIINGKRINMSAISGDDLLSSMMAHAGQLMGALGGINQQQGEKDEREARREERTKREPWESLVTCISDTYGTHHRIIGRSGEMDRAIRVLCRKEKNNPLFIGEPGVGKTELIYGLTEKIERGEVPAWLQGKKVYALDMSNIVAGASFHGEFEKRMKAVLEGVNRRHGILYIDEIHNIVDTGGGNNTINAGELLKPYLDTGSIIIIGSTTYQDYNKTIARRKALDRRFTRIDVKEPTAEEAIAIITGLIGHYEEHHNVKYEPEAIRYAVEQSKRLINDRFLPDKAIDIIDEAGAILHQSPLLNKQGKPKARRFQKVSIDTIRQVLVETCHIDAKMLTEAGNENLRQLAAGISAEIYGQDEAVRQVANAVMMSKAGLSAPDKPMASLLFVGPTGVGKTEVCKVLADKLGIPLIRFDMSEYTEKHTVSKLIGSPAGYVGYEEGGLLTDAIRNTPSCVLLLDEIEKAHSDIYNILLQVMDYASLTDNRGSKADFRNVILIMTSNAGAQYASQAAIGFAGGQTQGEAMLATVKKTFKPEFLNRLSGTVVFNSMDMTMAGLILDKKLRELSKRLSAKGITLQLEAEARAFLLEKGFTQQFGAREMDRAIGRHLTPLLMEGILFGELGKGGIAIVTRKGEALAVRLSNK